MEIPPSSYDRPRNLTHKERSELLDQLKDALNWIETYKNKEPILRSLEERKTYKLKSAESARISNQLSQHALIVRNQLAYLLTDTMEIMEIAIDMDPNDKKKLRQYQQLRRAYLKFMNIFKRDFRNN